MKIERNLAMNEPANIWRHLSQLCLSLLKEKGAFEVVRGLEALDLDSGTMPSLHELNLRLRYIGWSVTPVESFISSKEFLSNLANRVLPISIHMRTWNEIEFSAAPDYFHEAFGHVCLLASPEIRNFLQRYGEIGLKCYSFEGDDQYLEKLSDAIASRKLLPQNAGPQIHDLEKENVSELVQLTRLGWWTFETGLIQQNSEKKVWGAALISSSSEIKSFDQMPSLPLSLDCIWSHFDPSIHQQRYFYIESFAQLGLILDQFEQQMAFKTGGESGCLKAMKAKAESRIQFRDGLRMNGFIESVDSGIVHIRDSKTMAVSFFDCQNIAGIEPSKESV